MEKINRNISQFEVWVDRIAHAFFLFWNSHKVGILGTIVLNMVLVIFFFVFELRGRPHPNDPLVLIDFEREYEIIPPKEFEEPEPLLPQDAINPLQEWEAIRNIAIDATKEDLNPGLTDEKSIDADELYKDAQRIRDDMQRHRELLENLQDEEAIDIPNVEEKKIEPEEIGHYKGPTVISYFLKNRRALRLPVPAYKCEGGGQVVVDIDVLTDGTVGKASIDTQNSVIDDCMNQAAINAAKASLFNVSSASPSRQRGSITYLFVPQ